MSPFSYFAFLAIGAFFLNAGGEGVSEFRSTPRANEEKRLQEEIEKWNAKIDLVKMDLRDSKILSKDRKLVKNVLAELQERRRVALDELGKLPRERENWERTRDAIQGQLEAMHRLYTGYLGE
jgi:hypothetical protein